MLQPRCEALTSRNNLTDRFENIEHINKFTKVIGFNSVEIHKFIEVKDELSSFDILGINKNSADEVLDSAIVADHSYTNRYEELEKIV